MNDSSHPASAGGHDHGHDHPEPPKFAPEIDSPNMLGLFGALGFVCVAVIGLVIASWKLFDLKVTDELNRKANVQHLDVVDGKKSAAEMNASYGETDKDKGRYRIPVAEAKKQLIADPRLIAAPIRKPAPAPVVPAVPATPIEGEAPTDATAPADAAPADAADGKTPVVVAPAPGDKPADAAKPADAEKTPAADAHAPEKKEGE